MKNYIVVFINDEDEFEWCVVETTDETYARRVCRDMTPPPEYRVELRAITEPVETYRSYEVVPIP